MSVTCPYCRTPFEEEDEIVACPSCATQHHTDCLQENGGCTVFGCSQAPVEEPKISISTQDLTAGNQQPSLPVVPSFLNLSGPVAPIQLEATPETPAVPPSVTPSLPPVTPTPPPPRVPGAQPRPSGFVYSSPASVTPNLTFGGYVAPPPETLRPTLRKSRVVFVLLAIFLGAFGGHNFYAGYIKKGVIQLCITVFSCFFGSLISWVWAIVEACMVDRDEDGIAFV